MELYLILRVIFTNTFFVLDIKLFTSGKFSRIFFTTLLFPCAKHVIRSVNKIL
jgi:hypothetical protein